MLGDTRAIATIAVSDMKKASAFYEGTLGLKVEAREGEEVVSYATGGTVLNVYRSRYAGTNQATSATWVVGDRLDAVVGALRAKGVAFEHYDLPGMKREGDVHVGGHLRVAWFKDPDGNIHNLVSG